MRPIYVTLTSDTRGTKSGEETPLSARESFDVGLETRLECRQSEVRKH